MRCALTGGRNLESDKECIQRLKWAKEISVRRPVDELYLRDDTACTNHTAVPDLHPIKDLNACANPTVVSNGDFAREAGSTEGTCAFGCVCVKVSDVSSGLRCSRDYHSSPSALK